MAKAIANCTCAKCGTKFKREGYGHNRAEADRWQEWAEANMTMCGDCYKAEREKASEEKANKYLLPEINGKSEKQINYALSLRKRYINDNESSVKYAQKIMAKYDDMDADKKIQIATKCGLAPDTNDNMILGAVCKSYNVYRAYLCLTESDAGTLIDNLK
uniref:Phage protein n=1 Tax=Dulem virus 39 TaxID=3145757 RepID=A0AAU8B759_9CAUD